MDFNINSSFVIATLTGIAIMFWQRIKVFIENVMSKFVNTHRFCMNSSGAVDVQVKLWNYLEQKCKPILDFALPRLESRYTYVQKHNRFDIVVATSKIRQGIVLYKTPYGYAWITDKGENIVWIRGLFDCSKFLIDVSKFNVASSSNYENRLAIINKIHGNRQQYKAMTKGGSAHAPPGGIEKGTYNGGQPQAIADDYDNMFMTNPAISTLLTHSVDDFRPDDQAMDLVVVDEQLSSVDESVRDWVNGRLWYKERHIPWRYGLALHGLPGLGKTNAVRYISAKYNMPIFQFDLANMTNECFTSAWQRVISDSSVFGSIILLEDFDTIFHDRTNIIDSEMGITFDVLLNTIDGVQLNDGILLVVTANNFNNIDPALSLRPGRIEKSVEFKLPSADWRRKCAMNILKDWPVAIDLLVSLTENATHTTVVQTSIAVGLYLARVQTLELSKEELTKIEKIITEMNSNNQLVLEKWTNRPANTMIMTGDVKDGSLKHGSDTN